MMPGGSGELNRRDGNPRRTGNRQDRFFLIFILP
jgi:hypothetical protein